MSEILYFSPCCGWEMAAVMLRCDRCGHEFGEPCRIHDYKEALMHHYGLCTVDAEGQCYVELCPTCLSPLFSEHICECVRCSKQFEVEQATGVLRGILLRR